ncbi:MAG TPA: DUF4388 domain-containing protein [Anaeromyxobacteraceae bacterium]|nr:DUF4388 domain-containing protein [Anaeromyxobacteraceae bacterium]
MGPRAEEDLHGTVEETALWKVVTLNGVNGYTGSVAVQHASRSGTLYFDQGRLVHAETGEATGEAAFRRIMRWPGASYRLESDAAPTRVSITRGLAPLLVDLKGLPTQAEPAAAPAPSGSRLEWLVETTERIGRIPGVLGATLHGKDGPVAGHAARTPQDEAALELGRAGERLGDALGLGRLVLGVGHGARRLVLLLTTREHQLAVLVHADDHVEAVQAEIRDLLNRKP